MKQCQTTTKFFFLIFVHNWRPTYTMLMVDGITQQINAIQYNVCLIVTLSVLSLDRKYQRSLYDPEGFREGNLPALNNQRKSKQGCSKMPCIGSMQYYFLTWRSSLRIKPSMHGTLQTAPLSRGCLARFPVDCWFTPGAAPHSYRPARPARRKVQFFFISTILLLKPQPKFRLHHSTGTGAWARANGGQRQSEWKNNCKSAKLASDKRPSRPSGRRFAGFALFFQSGRKLRSRLIFGTFDHAKVQDVISNFASTNFSKSKSPVKSKKSLHI